MSYGSHLEQEAINAALPSGAVKFRAKSPLPIPPQLGGGARQIRGGVISPGGGAPSPGGGVRSPGGGARSLASSEAGSLHERGAVSR